MRWDSYHSPLGPLTLVADEHGLHEVRFPGRARDLDPADRDPDSLSEVVDQMEEYFAGGRQTFEFIVKEQPTRAGIDPYNKLIDRNGDDNTMDITNRF